MRFRYWARTKEGETHSGIIEASSLEAALDILHRRNFIVTKIKPLERGIFATLKRITLSKKVKLKDLIFFFRQLSVLFGADVPLVEALTSLQRQTQNPVLKRQIAEIAADVEGGKPLSEAMSRHPKTFSSFVVSMIRTGEAAGNLQKILEYLADHTERKYQLTSKIKGAMFYPVLVLILCILVGGGIMIFLMPKIADMYKDLEMELPLPTRILIALTDFSRKYGIYVVVGLGFLIFLTLRYLKTPSGKRLKSAIEIKIPKIGTVIRQVYLARMAENLGTLIKGGLPIVQALEVVADTIENTLYKQVLKETQNAVRRGETISLAFSESPLIPPTFSQMVKSGEKGGKLEEVLLEIADFYNKEVERAVDNLTNLIMPILIVLIGIVVAFIALSVLLPIYNMAGAI